MLSELVSATGDNAVSCSPYTSGSGGYFLGVQGGDLACRATMGALDRAAGLSGNACCLDCLGAQPRGVFSTFTIDQGSDDGYCRAAVEKINAALELGFRRSRRRGGAAQTTP